MASLLIGHKQLISVYKRLNLSLSFTMKHLFTLSLVFFSLTHLAQAERVEGVKLSAENYCNKLVNSEKILLSAQENDADYPFFLTYAALAQLGFSPEVKIAINCVKNQAINDLPIREKPKNNSP
jgi:hypothetical protein